MTDMDTEKRDALPPEAELDTDSETEVEADAETPLDADAEAAVEPESQADADVAEAEDESGAEDESEETVDAGEAEAVELDPTHLRLVEALIFASGEPVPESVIVERTPDGAPVKALIARLKADYAERGVNLVKVGKGWAFRTAPEIGPMLKIEREVSRKMSRAAVETLAVVAYHQPITRAEIEEIRGVSLSKGTMDVLFEAGWIRPRGRRRTPGKPVTWGTTEAFLEHFALESLDDLPGIDDLKAAGLLDKRPAIQTLGIQGAQGQDADTLEEPAEDPELLAEDPLDPEADDPEALRNQ